MSETTNQIREAITNTAAHGWASLTEVRAQMQGTSRELVDATLRQMSRARQITLIPRADQHRLTPADRAAAIHLGGEDCHLVTLN